jgi:hypothetical protein
MMPTSTQGKDIRMYKGGIWIQENSSDFGTGKRKALDPAGSETLLAGIQKEELPYLLCSKSTKFSRECF